MDRTTYTRALVITGAGIFTVAHLGATVTLAVTVTCLTVGALVGAVTGAWRRFAQHEARLDALEDQLESIARRQDTVDSTIGAVLSHVQNIDATLSQLRHRP